MNDLAILHLSAYKDGTECFETSAYKIQTPGNYPEENIQHSEHGERLKSRLRLLLSKEYSWLGNTVLRARVTEKAPLAIRARAPCPTSQTCSAKLAGYIRTRRNHWTTTTMTTTTTIMNYTIPCIF